MKKTRLAEFEARLRQDAEMLDRLYLMNKRLREAARKRYLCVGCHDETDEHTCDWDGFAVMVHELKILESTS